MIRLQNLTKVFRLEGSVKIVADDITATFPSGTSIALMGRNGAGKTTLLKMIAGTVEATSGQILSTGTISWPVGFAGAFHPDLTGAQNARFIARIYGIDTAGMIRFVEAFAELGESFHMPLRTYSAGMRSRLAFGVSVAIPFDTYLIDEVTSVGDTAFRNKSSQVLKARMRSAGAVVVSHSVNMLRDLCTAGAVLENGRLHYYPDLEEAIARHEGNMEP